MTTRISSKGWIIIPSELRCRYRLEPGAEVQIVDYGGILAIVPALKDPVKETAGLLAQDGKPLTQALLDDHRQESGYERS